MHQVRWEMEMTPLFSLTRAPLLLNIKSSCFLSVIVLNHRIQFSGFPGGSVVKYLPDNAEDTDLIPDKGSSYVLRTS